MKYFATICAIKALQSLCHTMNFIVFCYFLAFAFASKYEGHKDWCKLNEWSSDYNREKMKEKDTSTSHREIQNERVLLLNELLEYSFSSKMKKEIKLRRSSSISQRNSKHPYTTTYQIKLNSFLETITANLVIATEGSSINEYFIHHYAIMCKSEHSKYFAWWLYREHLEIAEKLQNANLNPTKDMIMNAKQFKKMPKKTLV